MSNSPIIQINVKKTHLMAIAILLLIGAATSTVNIRDTTKMFDRLDMDGNPITNLQDPTSAQHAATKSYVDSNVGGGGITDGSSLNWYKCADSGDTASCSVSCPADESLVAEARSTSSAESAPSWYDSWLTVDSQLNDDGSFGARVYGSSRVLNKGGTKGMGISVDRGSGSLVDAYVTAVVACKD